MLHSHDNHEHCCQHARTKYCNGCKVTYCLDCGKEWRSLLSTPYIGNPFLPYRVGDFGPFGTGIICSGHS